MLLELRSVLTARNFVWVAVAVIDLVVIGYII